MKARILSFFAFMLLALAAADVALFIPTLRTARRMAQLHEEIGGLTIYGHDDYVTQFGVPWWLIPLCLVAFAVGLFAWNRRLNRHDRNA